MVGPDEDDGYAADMNEKEPYEQPKSYPDQRPINSRLQPRFF